MVKPGATDTDTPSIVVTSAAGAVLYNSSESGGANGMGAKCKGLAQQKCEQVGQVGTCFWDKARCPELQSRPHAPYRISQVLVVLI